MHYLRQKEYELGALHFTQRGLTEYGQLYAVRKAVRSRKELFYGIPILQSEPLGGLDRLRRLRMRYGVDEVT